MAFLDNSGDIILDAVLTDTGRMRLAKGDGSFRITKFALGDDEINYRLYDKDQPSATADINIRTTPVFEAFTNNLSSLNSRLVSITRNDLLYMPVMKVNTNITQYNPSADVVQNGFVVIVDEVTATQVFPNQVGLIKSYGDNPGTITIDQGIDNVAENPKNSIKTDLKETQYLVEFDSRFASIADSSGVAKQYSYVDDDYMAAYYFSLNDSDKMIVTDIGTDDANSVLAGSRGTRFTFSIAGGISNLTANDYLFDKLGKPATINSISCKKISTTVRVTGLTTGYSLDIPIAIVKKVS